MEVFQVETLVHMVLFLLYLLFAFSILIKGRIDPLKLSVSLMFIFIALWALGKSVMHNTHTGFSTAFLALEMATPFNILFLYSFLLFGLLFWLRLPQKQGYLLLACGNLLMLPFVFAAALKHFFILKQCGFGWLALNNPEYGITFNVYTVIICVFFVASMLAGTLKRGVLIWRQGVLLSAIAAVLTAYYFFVPGLLLSNSADLLALPILVGFYYSMQVYGMFDFSHSEAAGIVFENIGEYLLLTGTGGRIENRGGLFAVKFQRTAEKKTNIRDCFADPAAISAVIGECIEKGAVRAIPGILIADDGPLSVSITASLIRRLNFPVGIAWIITDVSQSRMLEERLKKYSEELENDVKKRTFDLLETNKQLAKTNEDLEYFAYATYHDLNEPLRQIVTQLGYLEKLLGLKDPAAVETFDFVKSGAERMHTLLVDIRNYTAIREKAYPRQDVDMELCAKKAVNLLEPEIAKTSASVAISPLPKASGNPELYVSVFKNLIGNAIKYNTNKPEIRVYSEGAEISVADNGIGIEPEYREKVFVIFERLHTASEYSGSGAGLAICRKIVELYGGKISAQAGANGGSVFTFSVKVV